MSESWSILSKATQPLITSCELPLIISQRFLRVGWLGPGVKAYVIWPDIPTPFSIGDGPSCTPNSVWNVSVSQSFAVEDVVELLKFGVHYLKFHRSLPFFPFQSENIQVTLPLEDHLEGKVGFKTYKNYFTASAGWPVVTFLILVNIAAQVCKGVYFGLCTQIDSYILFILYLFYNYF